MTKIQEITSLVEKSWQDLYQKANGENVALIREDDIRCHLFQILDSKIGEEFVLLAEQPYPGSSRRNDILILDPKTQTLGIIELKMPEENEYQFQQKIQSEILKLSEAAQNIPFPKVGFCLIVDQYSYTGDPPSGKPLLESCDTNADFPIFKSIFNCCNPKMCLDLKRCSNGESDCDYKNVSGFTNLSWYLKHMGNSLGAIERGKKK